MKQKGFKLILTGVAAAATALSLTASTYAFVIIGNNVYVEDFNFNIEGYDGLQISLDGENYSQDITSDMIKEKIAGSVEAFNNTDFRGVTVSQKNGKAVYDDAGYLSFVKDTVDTSTYTHSFQDATWQYTADTHPDYICFDLYFKAVSSSSASNTKLAFGENTKIESTASQVELQTSFDTWSLCEDETSKFNGYYVATHHTAGDTVTQNVSNAMRLAVVNTDNENPLSVYEVTDKYDLGSAAITGRTDKAHDPYQSLMINYYNAYFPLYPFETEQTERKWLEENVAYNKPKVDADGNPVYTTVYVYDDNGEPVYVQDTNDDGTLKYVTRIDKNGNLVYDLDGNLVYDPVYKQKVDADGNPVTDSYGNPVYEQKTAQGPQATELVYEDMPRTLTGVYGAEDGEVFNTISAFGSKDTGSWQGSELGKFNSDGTMKVTIYLWLEGWDTDYLVGTSADASKLSVDLEFVMGSGN